MKKKKKTLTLVSIFMLLTHKLINTTSVFVSTLYCINQKRHSKIINLYNKSPPLYFRRNFSRHNNATVKTTVSNSHLGVLAERQTGVLHRSQSTVYEKLADPTGVVLSLSIMSKRTIYQISGKKKIL